MKKFYMALCCLLLYAFNAAAVNIAVVAPKMGHDALFGNQIIDGAQIAVDAINQDGGVLGEKINLIVVDDRCDDNFAVSSAQMMSLNSSENEKITMLIGPYCNNAFAQISDIYSKAKISRIITTPLAAGEYYSTADGMFKIGGLASDEADTVFELYGKYFAGKNLAVVYDKFIPQTTETANKLQNLFTENNLQNRIVIYESTAFDGDYEKLAKEVLLNSDTVFVSGTPENIAKIAQNLQQQKADVNIIVNENTATPFFFREMGNFAEGIYFLRAEDFKDSPYFTEDLVKLRLMGKEPRGLGVYGYAAVKLWKQLAEKAGSFDFNKINALKDANGFDLPWGSVDFVKGNASKNPGYEAYRFVNGEYTQLN